MPPRLDLLTKRWSPFDLPILPFLAPRVFQPWPCTRRRGYSRAAQTAQQKTEAVGEVYDDSSQDNGRGRGWFMGPTAQKHEVHKALQRSNLSTRDAANLENNWVQGLGGFLGEESSGISEEEEFRRKYEEIWGPRMQKRTAAPARGVQSGEERRGEKRDVLYNITNLAIRSRKSIWHRKQDPRGQARERARQHWLADLKARSAFNRRQLRFRAQNEARRRKIPIARPKWARYLPDRHSSLYTPFSAWHRHFAILNLRHEKFMNGKQLPNLATQQTPTKLSPTFIRELVEQESSVTLRLEWEKLPRYQRMKIWPELMIKTLQHHPDKALKVLAGTCAQEPFPPSYAISDCLNYIISHFLRNTEYPSRASVRSLCKTIFRLLHIGPKDYIHISQHSTFLLLSKADNYWVKKLYDALVDLKHPLHQNTLINFASRLAKSGEAEIAFNILRKLKSLDCDFNSPKMLSLCSTILDRSNRASNTIYSDSDIFEYMLECGMQPNCITYNILMQNSLKIGNHSTAWQIHDMMVESGIEPDAYSYSILLNDSKWRMHPAQIKRVMEMAREKGIRNIHIATDVLHAIFLHHHHLRTKTYDQTSEPQAAFHHMLKVYLENFRIEPLIRIIPWILEKLPDFQGLESPTTIQNELEHPPSPTLILMITAFVQGLQNPWSVRHFHDHFRNLLSTGDPVVADLIRTTNVWNSILMAFGKFSDTLEDCLTVIGDMLAPIKAVSMNASSPPTTHIEPESAPGSDHVSEPQYLSSIVGGPEAESPTVPLEPLNSSIPTQDCTPQQLETPEEHPRTPYIPPKPDIYTWSTLLKVFMDQQQTRAAERVLTMMQEKGVQPNIVTWNTLAVGYARLQDTEMTVDVISRLEKSGLKPDDITKTSLHKIRDRRGLLAAVKRKEQSVLNPGESSPDQLQDDIRKLNASELSPDFEFKDDEIFVIGNTKGFDEDVTMDGFVDDSDARKEAGEEVETRL
jgi:pentatricopeptide repeat protein